MCVLLKRETEHHECGNSGVRSRGSDAHLSESVGGSRSKPTTAVCGCRCRAYDGVTWALAALCTVMFSLCCLSVLTLPTLLY